MLAFGFVDVICSFWSNTLMLISLVHKFVYIANLKSGSSSIEKALAPYADICIDRTEFGKHDSYQDIARKFLFVFEMIPRNEFFFFASFREPMSWLSSLYFSHRRPIFAGSSVSTLGMTFDHFIEEWHKQHVEQIRPQCERLMDKTGKVAVDFIIDYASLQNDFDAVCRLIGLPVMRLGWENVSYGNANTVVFDDRIVDRIRGLYKSDFRVYNALRSHDLRL